MTIWRIDAVIVPKKGLKEELPTFYLECLASELERRAMNLLAYGRKDCRVNLTFGPLETPRKSTANRYVSEGVYLAGLNVNDIFAYSEEI